MPHYCMPAEAPGGKNGRSASFGRMQRVSVARSKKVYKHIIYHGGKKTSAVGTGGNVRILEMMK